MKIYKFRIKAIKIGSIGNKKLYIITVTANNLKDAVLKLYNTHEHIFIEKVNGVKYDYCHPNNNIL
jgi:hypothetical protein